MDIDAPKIMVSLAGRPLLSYVLQTVEEAGIKRENTIVVVGYRYREVVDFLGSRYRWVLQDEQLGTGHAVLSAEEMLSSYNGTVMVLCGDVPLITREIILDFFKKHVASGAVCSVLTTEVNVPFGYGRILRDEAGNLIAIVEEKEATQEEKLIREINTGSFCFEKEILFNALSKIDNNNAKGEYYLTDVVKVMIQEKLKVNAVRTEDNERVLGINTIEQLKQSERLLEGAHTV